MKDNLLPSHISLLKCVIHITTFYSSLRFVYVSCENFSANRSASRIVRQEKIIFFVLKSVTVYLVLPPTALMTAKGLNECLIGFL